MHALLPLCGVLCLAPFALAQRAIATVYGTTNGGYTGYLVAAAGDMDNDAVPDLLVSSPNVGNGLVQIVSGATRAARNVVNPVTGGWAMGILRSSPDMNNDGVRDFLVDRGGNLLAYSGANGALLWQTAGWSIRDAVPIGDVDADGRGDVAVVVYIGSNDYLWTLRGSNGTQLQALATGLPTGGRTLVNLGDIDNDGKPEVAFGGSNGIWIYHTSPPAFVRQWSTDVVQSGIANVVGDARKELLSSSGSNVYAWNPVNGALLRSWPGGSVFAAIGDLDGDGYDELAIRNSNDVDIFSGANGTKYATWLGSDRLRCNHLAGVGDVDGDGFGDLLIGDENASANPPSGPVTGGWQLVSGKLLATMAYLPVQCSGGPWFPQLGMTRPVLGSWCTVEGRDGPSMSGGGMLALSMKPTLSTSFGVVGCDAWFDVHNWVVLYQPGGPNWQYQLPIPLVPQLAGLGIALQAMYFQTSSPIGMDLSNGVWARLGW